MGQIVIDIPANKRRRYRVTDEKSLTRLLSELDTSATRLSSTRAELTNGELEEIADIVASTKALNEIAKTGKVYSWKDVKAELSI